MDSKVSTPIVHGRPFHVGDCTWVPSHRCSFVRYNRDKFKEGGAFVWEELVVKRYLCAKTAGLLTLEYYLLISLFAEDLEIYGVKIVEWQNSNQRPGLTMSGQQIFRPIALLSKGTVVPTSLVVEFIGGCRLCCRGTEDLQ